MIRHAFALVPGLVTWIIAWAALGFELGLPVDCHLGETCVIQKYVDVDPGPEARDFTCGSLANDGHAGVDFRIPDLQAMRAGVAVFAAADGEVRGVRDGMADVDVTTLPEGAVKGRECGNGVAIRHADGWETQYCHLRRGSIVVRSGDRVAAGDRLGFVGMSGAAQFPHLHLSVRKGGRMVDPYGIDAPKGACGGAYATLWRPELKEALAYRPGGILLAGFHDGPLDGNRIQAGGAALPAIRRDAPALVIWYLVYGIRRDDVMRVAITAPDGTVFFEDTRPPHPKDQAQAYRYAGRRVPAGGLAPGVYRGEVTLLRDGGVYDRRAFSVTLR